MRLAWLHFVFFKIYIRYKRREADVQNGSSYYDKKKIWTQNRQHATTAAVAGVV